MAFTISTIYKAYDKFSPVLRKMEQANASFAAKQDKAFLNIRNSITSVKNQLIGLAGGVSIASLFYTGATAVTQYDEALKSLSAITGITGKEFEPFKKQVIEVASRTKKAAYDVAKAFELVGSAQPELLKDAKALATVTESAIILSKASRDDVAVSAANLTSVLNQFSLGADQANRAINVLAAGSEVGAANISEVAESMKNVGSVAATSNATVEETVALIEVLGKYQLKGAEAGTKLRGVFLKLQQAGYGYASGQFNINDAITEANKKMSLLTTAKAKDAAMTKIFGAENISAGKIILGNQKLFEEYTKGVTGTDKAQQQAAINSASFSERLRNLRARFENLIIKGNESSGALNFFGKILGFVTNHLDKIIVVVGSLIAIYTTYYAVMTMIRLATIAYNVVLGISAGVTGIYSLAVGKSTIAIKTAAIVTKAWTAAQWLINAAMTANPIGLIIVGIGALIFGIVMLIKHWDKVKAKMDEWSNSAIFQILSIAMPILKIIELIGFMQDRWQGIKNAFTEGGLLSGLMAIGKAILSFVLKPLEIILKAVGKIPGMKWAQNASDNISKFRADIDKDLTQKSEPVNTEKAKVDRHEEINRQQMEIMLTNKTDKQANVKSNPARVPVVQNTW